MQIFTKRICFFFSCTFFFCRSSFEITVTFLQYIVLPSPIHPLLSPPNKEVVRSTFQRFEHLHAEHFVFVFQMQKIWFFVKGKCILFVLKELKVKIFFKIQPLY